MLLKCSCKKKLFFSLKKNEKETPGAREQSKEALSRIRFFWRNNCKNRGRTIFGNRNNHSKHIRKKFKCRYFCLSSSFEYFNQNLNSTFNCWISCEVSCVEHSQKGYQKHPPLYFYWKLPFNFLEICLETNKIPCFLVACTKKKVQKTPKSLLPDDPSKLFFLKKHPGKKFSES